MAGGPAVSPEGTWEGQQRLGSREASFLRGGEGSSGAAATESPPRHAQEPFAACDVGSVPAGVEELTLPPACEPPVRLPPPRTPQAPDHTAALRGQGLAGALGGSPLLPCHRVTARVGPSGPASPRRRRRAALCSMGEGPLLEAPPFVLPNLGNQGPAAERSLGASGGSPSPRLGQNSASPPGTRGRKWALRKGSFCPFLLLCISALRARDADLGRVSGSISSAGKTRPTGRAVGMAGAAWERGWRPWGAGDLMSWVPPRRLRCGNRFRGRAPRPPARPPHTALPAPRPPSCCLPWGAVPGRQNQPGLRPRSNPRRGRQARTWGGKTPHSGLDHPPCSWRGALPSLPQPVFSHFFPSERS